MFSGSVEHADASDVLVIDNASRLDEGCIGDLTVLEAKAAELAGLVVGARIATRRTGTDRLSCFYIRCVSIGSAAAG
jgi:regulator of RNase E activity RraA